MEVGEYLVIGVMLEGIFSSGKTCRASLITTNERDLADGYVFGPFGGNAASLANVD